MSPTFALFPFKKDFFPNSLHSLALHGVRLNLECPLKEWTFRVCNGMLKLAIYEIYECTKWLLETRLPIIPNEIHQHLIINHMHEISKSFQLLRPRYLMCMALKHLISGNQRLAKCQFAHAIRLANDLQLDSERKHIEMTRKQIFKVISKRKPKSIIKTKTRRTNKELISSQYCTYCIANLKQKVCCCFFFLLGIIDFDMNYL